MAKKKNTDSDESSALGAAGGAAAGAAAGSVLGPLGAAVGAVIGGVAGSGAKLKGGSLKKAMPNAIKSVQNAVSKVTGKKNTKAKASRSPVKAKSTKSKSANK